MTYAERSELVAWGWDGSWEEVFRPLAGGGLQPARVVVDHRDRLVLELGSGEAEGRRVGTLQPVCTGDWVLVEPGPEPSDPWSVRSVLPRRSALVRRNVDGVSGPQVLAANVDRLWIVHGLERPPNLRKIERFLTMGWESGAVPEVVLTKSDLCECVEQARDDVVSIAPGAAVWVLGVGDAIGLAALRETLRPSTTIALVGPSGAGKSTLINRLAEEEVARTGDVRARDGKGRHTTTARELIDVRGTLFLDTPGLRALAVTAIEEGLERVFPEIDELAASCRFRDCTHTQEPGCAVLAAVGNGSLDRARLESFQKLRAEALALRRREDPVEKNKAIAEYKTAMKTLKNHHPKYES